MMDDASLQERVFAFLENDSQGDAKRIDTHASSVFLQRDRVLKIKRAVRFPYLDYSTLERRKAACEQELRINRPFAPLVYRRVVPITLDQQGGLAVDGDGTPIEYAVEMMRFDERQTLDHLARDGALDRRLVEALADEIVRAHRMAPPAPAEPWLKSIPGLIEDNTRALRAAGGFASDQIDALQAAMHAALARVGPLLEQRGKQGFVRRCHGDLHLGNIVVIDGRPVLFDAIEFDEQIASIDVLYDLAFLLMDLLAYHRRDEANALFNRYLELAPETIDALAALPLLMSLRAAIRAQVMLARSGRAASGVAAPDDEARAYFELAGALIHPRRPVLVAVGGLSGTGKSVLARAIASDIAPAPGAVVLRSDLLRKQMFGVDAQQRLPGTAYEPGVGARVYEQLAQAIDHVLAQGHSVIADAVFARESERALVGEVARRHGTGFAGLFLVADLKTREQRIAQRRQDASDATVEIARLQDSYDLGTLDWDVIDAAGTPAQTLDACRSRIATIIDR